jgi:hypothetical protein
MRALSLQGLPAQRRPAPLACFAPEDCFTPVACFASQDRFVAVQGLAFVACFASEDRFVAV